MIFARKLVTSTMTVLGIAVLAVSAAADAPKPAAAPQANFAAASSFKKSPFKISSKPTTTLSPDQTTKMRAALKKAIEQYAKDKDATKLMNGGAGLSADGDMVFRRGAARIISQSAASSASASSNKTAAGGGLQLIALPGTYAIESGEVISATTSQPCDGSIQIAMTIKNRGAKIPAGVTPRLVASLARGTDVISSGWINLPALDTGANATVQLPSLRHRAAVNNGQSCASGDIVVTPSFVNVDAAADYRLLVNLQADGADATLVSGIFVSPNAGSGSSGSSGGTGDCGPVNQKCASGACALICPPCPGGWVESGGGCYPDLGYGTPHTY